MQITNTSWGSLHRIFNYWICCPRVLPLLVANVLWIPEEMLCAISELQRNQVSSLLCIQVAWQTRKCCFNLSQQVTTGFFPLLSVWYVISPTPALYRGLSNGDSGFQIVATSHSRNEWTWRKESNFYLGPTFECGTSDLSNIKNRFMMETADWCGRKHRIALRLKNATNHLHMCALGEELLWFPVLKRTDISMVLQWVLEIWDSFVFLPHVSGITMKICKSVS